MKKITNDMDKLLFISAAEELELAQSQGNPISGVDAFLTAHNKRLRAEDFSLQLREVDLSPERREYFRRMGAFVELAVELSQAVDPKG